MKNVDQKRYQDAQDKENRASVNVAAIVKVTAFDPAKMTVDVQPISKHLENGDYQSQPPILGVPVSGTKSGGFIIRTWVKAGDIGLIVYIDHDIDKAVADGQESKPNTERNHSTSDAVFVGGLVPGNAPASGLPPDSVVIASEGGGVYLAVSASGITIKGSLEIDGAVHATQQISGDAGVTAAGDVTGAGVSLDNHTHPYAWTDPGGSGNTSPPS